MKYLQAYESQPIEKEYSVLLRTSVKGVMNSSVFNELNLTKKAIDEMVAKIPHCIILATNHVTKNGKHYDLFLWNERRSI